MSLCPVVHPNLSTLSDTMILNESFNQVYKKGVRLIHAGNRNFRRSGFGNDIPKSRIGNIVSGQQDHLFVEDLSVKVLTCNMSIDVAEVIEVHQCRPA